MFTLEIRCLFIAFSKLKLQKQKYPACLHIPNFMIIRLSECDKSSN